MRTRVPLATVLVWSVAACDMISTTSPDLADPNRTSLAQLQPNDVVILSGSQSGLIDFSGGRTGAEFALIPFHVSSIFDDTLKLAVKAVGVEQRAVTGRHPASPSLLPTGDHDWTTQAADASHAGRLEATATTVRPLLSFRGESRASRVLRPSSSGWRQGDLVPLRVPDLLRGGGRTCNEPLLRTGRVEAVSEKFILVTDTANPRTRLVSPDFAALALVLDDEVAPSIAGHFGEPPDVDQNGRVIIFFSEAVNRFTAQGSQSTIRGFFFGPDLFPRGIPELEYTCPASNQAEILYVIAPDPAGSINGNVREVERVIRDTPAIVAHELQHLVNLGRRAFVNRALATEEPWLDEGLSHIAEEILFFRMSGIPARTGIGVQHLQSERAIRAFVDIQLPNMLRYLLYLRGLSSHSVLGSDGLATRGATWAFLRYAADHAGTTDQQFFWSLANSRTSGIRNLNAVLGGAALSALQRWSVAVLADHRFTPRQPEFRQSSWDFANLLPMLVSDGVGQESLWLGGRQSVLLNLPGAASGVIRFAIPAGGRAEIATAVSGYVPREALQLAVVRLR